jgi:hypothetical protein
MGLNHTIFFVYLGDTELLKEMVLSIPLHVINVHEFPSNKKFKVLYFFSPCSYCEHLLFLNFVSSFLQQQQQKICFHQQCVLTFIIVDNVSQIQIYLLLRFPN